MSVTVGLWIVSGLSAEVSLPISRLSQYESVLVDVLLAHGTNVNLGWVKEAAGGTVRCLRDTEREIQEGCARSENNIYGPTETRARGNGGRVRE